MLRGAVPQTIISYVVVHNWVCPLWCVLLLMVAMLLLM
jgi:hypothetical protein